MRTLLVCLFFILPAKVWADCTQKSGNVVFFDFNKSKEEVEGARQSAQGKCQNFYVATSKDEADSILKKIDSQGGEISSLIMSGHHKFGIFWGSNFQMTIGGISDLLDQYPKTKAKVKNLYLWGCYTNNVDKLEKWLKSFPNLNYVFGYNLKSPLSSQGIGVEYLQKALEHQSELEKMKSLEEIKKFLDTQLVPGSSDLHLVTAAIFGKAQCDQAKFDDFYYSIDYIEGGKKTLSTIDKFTDRGKCKSAASDYKKDYQKTLQSYWQGELEILPLGHPESKTPAKNPIRTVVYPWANKYAYCFSGSVFKTETSDVGLGQLLNLVYFNEIKNNFFEYFNKDKEKLLKSLKDSEIQGLLSKGKDLTRKEILELNQKLSKVEPQTDEIKAYNFKLKMFLVNLDDRCADVNWLEDASAIQKPPSFCTNPK